MTNIVTKPLYILVNDCGDGSYSLQYVLDANVIKAMEEAYSQGLIDAENHAGIDGDGLNYKEINIPASFTAEDLGISVYSLITLESFFNSLNLDDASEVFSSLNIPRPTPPEAHKPKLP